MRASCSDAGPQHPARSGLVERMSPVSFAGPKRANPPGIAFRDLRRSTSSSSATGLRPPRCRDPVAPAGGSPAAGHHPAGQDAIMKSHDAAIRAEAHDWGDRVEIGNGMAVHLAPMRHWTARGLFDRNKALWPPSCWRRRAGSSTTSVIPAMATATIFREAKRRFGGFRLAILPIGAYEPRWFMRDQHMNPAEAVQVMIDCGRGGRWPITGARCSSPTRPSRRRARPLLQRWPSAASRRSCSAPSGRATCWNSPPPRPDARRRPYLICRPRSRRSR